MTPECAQAIRDEIADIRSRLPSIDAQVWQHGASDGAKDKAEVIADLKSCCEISEAALLRAGYAL